MEAYLVTRGGRGARVSVNTLESYRIGVQVLLDWAGPAGVSLNRCYGEGSRNGVAAVLRGG
ncbi:hypothetical protein HNQ10_000022 [Deinococcus metallilatus]|uniref:Integrase n=1 Tax=Deinococcus metallilatus TaxID=1211322 RepID=A0ABR6MMN7_9DEIO|nr:hypothetical protein [Deinococcus metallilatus]